jgi:DNA polymerase (family 10)
VAPAPALDNEAIAERLDRLATLLDAAGSTRYAVRAYRRAAELVRSAPMDVSALVRAGRARELRGVGRSIEARLQELVETGSLAEIAELEASLSPSRIRRASERARAPRVVHLNVARAALAELAQALGGAPAGDARRGVELPERHAVAVASLDVLEESNAVVSVLSRDDDRAVVATTSGLPVEVVAGPLGTALVRATGSSEWVASLGDLPAAETEETLFAALGLPFVPPELREVGAPAAPADLLRLEDVHGDLHVHTTWSDGRASVLEMGEAARALGHEYLAICDHTRAVRVVPGLDADDLRRQGEEIAAANEALAPFRILRGAECDILPDGSLDLPDDVLAELEWVQVSLHAGQRRPRDELTRIVTDAIRHPAARCLSHPKGRMLGRRPENAVDLDEVFAICLESGVAVEVNGLPDRLDLSGAHVAEAMAAGVDIVCSTDAHSTRGLELMELSVVTARRGGAPRGRVLNTLRLDTLLARTRR